jgi:hypothetical protein
VTPADVRLLRHPVYRFAAKFAPRWRDGRVLLAGDAAHQMPPFLGQGMCSGVRDVKNLAWKLDLVLRGLAEERILDSYAPERIPQVRYLIEQSVELGSVMCITDPVAAAERDDQLRLQAAALAANPEAPAPTPSPPPLQGGLSAPDDPLAGTLAPQGQVEQGGRVGRFDDVVGGGFALIGSSGDPGELLGVERLDFLERIATTIVSADPAARNAFKDVEGTYGRWFADHNPYAILVRPDFYVYGCAGSSTEVCDLIDRLHIQLGGARGSRSMRPGRA